MARASGGISGSSSLAPERFAACLASFDAGVDCFKVAFTWHLPFVILDVLGILFAEAGPKLIRVNSTTAIMQNSQTCESIRNTKITKINSHCDLIKYSDAEGMNMKKGV